MGTTALAILIGCGLIEINTIRKTICGFSMGFHKYCFGQFSLTSILGVILFLHYTMGGLNQIVSGVTSNFNMNF